MALQEEFEQQGNYLFRRRSVLPLAILVLGMFAYIHHVIDLLEKGKNEIDELYNYFCLSVTLVGLGIRVYTVGYAAENTSGRNTAQQIADEINRTGAYSLVRHPLYVGNFLMWLGFGLLSHNAWFLLAFTGIYWIYYERIMFAEEQFLRKKFGNDYLDWAKDIPACIPRFKTFKKPITNFNITKAIKQEKTGLLFVFLLYFLFYEIALSIMSGKISIHFNFWFYSPVVTLFAYVLIKVMEKKRII